MLARSDRPRPETDTAWTRFGERVVPAEAKARLVHDVFANVAPRYDLMNDLMSAGIHRLWKDRLVAWLNPRPPMHILDVAGGTGDVALRLHRRLRSRGTARAQGGQVVVCDINAAMLEIGRDRAFDDGVVGRIEWVCGDAEALPWPTAAFDAYTIAFGIRNVTDLPRALAEARRVLKPGGRFLCLEFSLPATPGVEPLYEAYARHVLPRIGELVTGHGEAYRYLVESIRHFPDQKAFADLVREAGLERVRYRNLSGGIAALHSAWRL